MNYAQIIAGFRELLKESNNFDRQALQDLPQLEQTLNQFSDEEFDPFAKAIANWCAAHQPLGDNLRNLAEAVRWTPQKANRADEEGIKKNISVIRETVKQKAANPQPPAPNSNQTVSNDD